MIGQSKAGMARLVRREMGILKSRQPVLCRYYTCAQEDEMDFFRNMQPRDWMIAAAAFVAGAIIF